MDIIRGRKCLLVQSATVSNDPHALRRQIPRTVFAARCMVCRTCGCCLFHLQCGHVTRINPEFEVELPLFHQNAINDCI
jgi:hypothetical protein